MNAWAEVKTSPSSFLAAKKTKNKHEENRGIFVLKHQKGKLDSGRNRAICKQKHNFTIVVFALSKKYNQNHL